MESLIKPRLPLFWKRYESNIIMRSKKAIYYLTPLLLTAYPVFYMLSINVKLVNFADIGLSLFSYEISTLIILFIFWRIFQNREKTIFLTSVMVIIFFTYGQIYNLLGVSWGHWVLIPLNLALVGVSIWIINTKSNWVAEYCLIFNYH